MDEPKAYVPGFDHDVFISYAHVDDLTPADGEKGWVERFHDHLVVKLGQRIGRADRVRIWRDPKLTGNELFDDVIKNRINRSAVFLSLTSLGHLASDYCRREVRWFHDHSVKQGPGLRVGERMRFFNVLLYNVPIDDWPAEFGRTRGFPFYRASDRQDEDVGRPLDPDDDPEFQDRLWDLVDAIYRTLTEFKSAESEDRPDECADACDVYLAAVADSLRLHGPRQTAAALRRRRPPECRPRRHRAGEARRPPARRRLDPEEIEDGAQAAFLAELEHGERGERPYDFVRGEGAADLAADVAEKLRQLAEAARAPRRVPPAVLLDIQRQDELCVLDLSRALLERQVVPYINPQEKDPRGNDEILQARLRQVGALIVVYGPVHEPRPYAKLDRPRPPGKDPLEWMVENMD